MITRSKFTIPEDLVSLFLSFTVELIIVLTTVDQERCGGGGGVFLLSMHMGFR